MALSPSMPLFGGLPVYYAHDMYRLLVMMLRNINIQVYTCTIACVNLHGLHRESLNRT